MRRIVYTTKFKKDYKLCKKRHYPMAELVSVFDLLANDTELDTKYKAHKLSGSYEGCWECQIGF